jgi:hypothetical protein
VSQKPNLMDFANRLMLVHMRTRCGIGASEVLRCREVTKKLVEEFATYIMDADELATPREFCRVWILEIDRVSPVRAELVGLLKEHEGGNAPFPKWYADGVKPQELPL